MKKKFTALNDVLMYFLICGPMISVSLLIFISGSLFDHNWAWEHWYIVILFASCISVSLVGVLFIRRMEIYNNETVYFHTVTFFSNLRKISNIDTNWNDNVFISEVVSVEIVKLTDEEKETKVYYKRMRNKYLKINLKFNKTKYVYIGNYANFQIRRIICILMNKS